MKQSSPKLEKPGWRFRTKLFTDGLVASKSFGLERCHIVRGNVQHPAEIKIKARIISKVRRVHQLQVR